MTKKLFALAVLVLFTASCSIYHVNSVDSTDAFYPATAPEDVVYMEDIDRDHEIIGTVIVNAERKQRDIDDIINKMKREAAILGGNAITDIRSDATGSWKKLPAQPMIGNGYVRANYSASVVVFK